MPAAQTKAAGDRLPTATADTTSFVPDSSLHHAADPVVVPHLSPTELFASLTDRGFRMRSHGDHVVVSEAWRLTHTDTFNLGRHHGEIVRLVKLAERRGWRLTR